MADENNGISPSKLERDQARKARKRATDAAYYARNREKLLAQSAEWAKNNKKKLKEYHSAYHAEHKEIRNARVRKWHYNNKDRVKARSIKYHKTYRPSAATLEKAKDWKAKNLEKMRMYVVRRRANKRSSSEHYTVEQMKALRSKIKNLCANCLKKKDLSIDHIVPLARGGSNAIRNIQFLCHSCNSRKNARDPIEFARIEGRLL